MNFDCKITKKLYSVNSQGEQVVLEEGKEALLKLNFQKMNIRGKDTML